MKLLVVTPEAIDADALRVAAGDEAADAEVMVVTPATQESALRFWMSDADEAIAEARQAAETTQENLAEAGIDAVADTGESEPAVAIQDALATFPADRIVVFTREDGDYREDEGLADAEARFGVPWQVLAAVHLTETRFGRIRGTSTAGARGPMQFLPSTWEAYGLGGDIEDTRDAILGAANYLAANGAARGDLDNALYRYNPTPRYVNAVKAYVERMRADERAFLGYWGWQVFYVTVLGDVWLRVGYEALAERPVTPADLG